MIKNFLFHRVNPERDRLWDPMDVKLFEKCIRAIRDRYQVVLLEDLVSSPHLTDARANYATITFDDGYHDNLAYAAPILQKYQCAASFYVVTDCIDKNVLTWNHRLDHSFAHTRISKLALPFDFLPSYLQTPRLDSVESRIAYVKKLRLFLKILPHERRQIVLDKIFSTLTDVEMPSLMMSWEDVRQLRTAGHYIGSHTMTHSMLGTMSDADAILQELVGSRNQIHAQLGYWPTSIAYPVGSYSPLTIQLCCTAGYQTGLAVMQDVYDPTRQNAFEIRRIELYNESWLKTQLRISNILEEIKTLIRYK